MRSLNFLKVAHKKLLHIKLLLGIRYGMKIRIMGKDGFKVIDLNRRKAIHERCLNCLCWIPSEVTNCTFKDCQLWEFRTDRGKQNPKQRQHAIRLYCIWCSGGQPREVLKCVSKTCPLFYFRSKGLKKTEKNAS